MRNADPDSSDAAPATYCRPRERRGALPSMAQKCEDRIGAIVTDQPLKAAWLNIALMQGGLGLVKLIEITEELLHASVRALV